MAKRKKLDGDTLIPGGKLDRSSGVGIPTAVITPEDQAAIQAVAEGRAEPVNGQLPTAADEGIPPTIEERVAKLEALLGEKDRLIMRQANALAIAAENGEELRKCREKVERLRGKADVAKRASTEAKKSYEAAVEEFIDLQKDLSSGQQKLPFPPETETRDSPSATTSDGGSPDGGAGRSAAPEATVETWRGVLLDTLDIPRGTIAKLFDANLCTVGDLSDYQQPSAAGHCRKLTDIPGIGEASAERIGDALAQFWQDQAPAGLDEELAAGCREVEEGRGEESDDYADDDAEEEPLRRSAYDDPEY